MTTEARTAVRLPRFAGLTVFFPMYNEEAYIRSAVGAAQEVCRELVEDGEIGDYEVLVVDDASTDATGQIAESLAAANPRVRVVGHGQNRKLGGCLKTGFSEARSELVLYADADLPFDFAEARKACRLLRLYGADIVSAYRHDRTAEGPRRALYSWAYNLAIRVLFGLRIRDVNFSFKLCRRGIFEQVRLASEGSFIDAELLVRAHRLGFRIIQFGVDYFPRTRGPSTLSSWGVIARVLQEMLRLRAELRGLRPIEGVPSATPAAPSPDGRPHDRGDGRRSAGRRSPGGRDPETPEPATPRRKRWPSRSSS